MALGSTFGHFWHWALFKKNNIIYDEILQRIFVFGGYIQIQVYPIDEKDEKNAEDIT